MAHKTISWQNETGRTVFAQAWMPERNPSDVVLIVHGLGEHSGRYASWAERFLENNLAVYAFDLHGHGRTTGRRGHTDAFGYIYDDIKYLLNTIQSDYPESKIHLYGHSMGGALSLGFAAFRAHNADVPPLVSIVTTGTAIRPGFEPPAWKLKLAAWLDQFVPWLTLGNELDPSWLSSDKNIVDAYNSDPLVHDRISVRWYNEWMKIIEAIKLHPERVKMPVYMLHGGSDKATSPNAAEEMSRVLRAKFQNWPGAFHELHHEPCKDRVFVAVIDWIHNHVG